MIRPDEIYQYLEQAHRWQYGYGQIAWEFRLGARTWLLPSFTAIVLWLCDTLGYGHPDFYITANKIWLALLSLLIPSGMYLFSRRIWEERTAILAFLFGCFWHEFIIFSTHAVAEQYATEIFFLALLLLSPTATNRRLWLIGLLLGLTIALRLPYLPIVGIFGLILLTAYPWRQWLWILGGGVCGLIVWGLVDFLTWGRFWHSPRLYISMFAIHDPLTLFSNQKLSHFRHLNYLFDSSYGLYALIALAVLYPFRNWVLLTVFAVGLGFHLYLANQEYSNTFILWPLAWMLIASTSYRIAATSWHKFKALRWLQLVPTGIASVALACSLFSFSRGIPDTSIHLNDYYLTPLSDGIFRQQKALAIARDLSRRPPAEVKSVLWSPGAYFIFGSGGYYYLHHRVPVFFTEILPDHNKFTSPPLLQKSISHIVTSKLARIKGFIRHREFDDLAIFVNANLAEVVPPVGHETDIVPQGAAMLERFADQHQIDHPPIKPALLEKNNGPFRYWQ